MVKANKTKASAKSAVPRSHCWKLPGEAERLSRYKGRPCTLWLTAYLCRVLGFRKVEVQVGGKRRRRRYMAGRALVFINDKNRVTKVVRG